MNLFGCLFNVALEHLAKQKIYLFSKMLLGCTYFDLPYAIPLSSWKKKNFVSTLRVSEHMQLSVNWVENVLFSFFCFPSQKQQRAPSNKPRLCNHCHVSASAFLCLCFCWYWSWQPLAGGRRFKPEGSAPYQRLIATSERGIAPGKEKKKKTSPL